MIFKKGTVFRSIGDPHCDDFIYVYNPLNSHDDYIYKTEFADYLTKDKGEDQRYYTDYAAIRDITVLPTEEAISIFEDLMNVDVFKMEHERLGAILKRHNVNKDDPWFIFCRAFENPEVYLMALTFMDRVAKRYDAMMDYNDNDFYHNVSTAAVIFNPRKNLRKVESSKF